MLDQYNDLVKVIKEAWNDKDTLNIDFFKHEITRNLAVLANPNFKVRIDSVMRGISAVS